MRRFGCNRGQAVGSVGVSGLGVFEVLCGGERFSHISWWDYGIGAVKKVLRVNWLPEAGFRPRATQWSLSGANLLTGGVLTGSLPIPLYFR